MKMTLLKSALLCAAVGGAQVTMPMAQQAGASIFCSDLTNEIKNMFVRNGTTQLVESAQAPVIQVVEAAPIVIAAAPVVAQSVWEGVRENSKEIASNLVQAGANVASYVPYALRQITHEAKVLTNALKDMPITSTALIVAAVYGCWKAYTWLNKPEVRQSVSSYSRQISERWSGNSNQQR